MCCFSRAVQLVADTNIFARASREGRQFLAYSMKFRSTEDLAMILPIPTPVRSAEDAVRFINLERYPEFFTDLKKGFPEPPPPRAKGGAASGAGGGVLAVVEVGGFEASFVPAVGDFARLDARFRLPADTWDRLPQYRDFGFAVFKLRKPERGEKKVHPMAFEFPRADRDVLFFPTVHIHDGTVPARARFDHALYCQLPEAPRSGWDESPGLANGFVNTRLAEGLVDPDGHVYRRRMRGMFENRDVGV
ncbi:MAG TPA: hypothetical protein VH092_30460 [Urbifossiella sp.]|jgi:hypothetical protein|nr:hypothetical protein [Urbifossiella sp.]